MSEAKGISTKVSTNFNNDVIKESLKSNFTNPKTKISDEAVQLMAELAKTLVIESVLRAAKQCTLQNKSTVTLDHMESALPQIMLDFP